MKCLHWLRYIGLDVHKKWMQICILNAAGKVIFEGRCPATPDQLRGFARTLRASDAVALEATTNTWAIVELLEKHAGRVAVSNPLRTKAIAWAKIKTDKVDARVLADLLRCDYLPDVWRPDAQTLQWRQTVRFCDRFVRRRHFHRHRIDDSLTPQTLRDGPHSGRRLLFAGALGRQTRLALVAFLGSARLASGNGARRRNVPGVEKSARHGTLGETALHPGPLPVGRPSWLGFRDLFLGHPGRRLRDTPRSGSWIGNSDFAPGFNRLFSTGFGRFPASLTNRAVEAYA